MNGRDEEDESTIGGGHAGRVIPHMYHQPSTASHVKPMQYVTGPATAIWKNPSTGQFYYGSAANAASAAYGSGGAAQAPLVAPRSTVYVCPTTGITVHCHPAQGAAAALAQTAAAQGTTPAALTAQMQQQVALAQQQQAYQQQQQYCQGGSGGGGGGGCSGGGGGGGYCPPGQGGYPPPPDYDDYTGPSCSDILDQQLAQQGDPSMDDDEACEMASVSGIGMGHRTMNHGRMGAMNPILDQQVYRLTPAMYAPQIGGDFDAALDSVAHAIDSKTGQEVIKTSLDVASDTIPGVGLARKAAEQTFNLVQAARAGDPAAQAKLAGIADSAAAGHPGAQSVIQAARVLNKAIDASANGHQMVIKTDASWNLWSWLKRIFGHAKAAPTVGAVTMHPALATAAPKPVTNVVTHPSVTSAAAASSAIARAQAAQNAASVLAAQRQMAALAAAQSSYYPPPGYSPAGYPQSGSFQPPAYGYYPPAPQYPEYEPAPAGYDPYAPYGSAYCTGPDCAYGYGYGPNSEGEQDAANAAADYYFGQ